MTLHDIQEASYRRASSGILSSWPPEKALGADDLAAFLEECRYCVLATTTSGSRPQARPIAFVPFRDALWFATGASGRLQNLERTPWVSVVISEGFGAHHRAVIADGPVAVSASPPAGLLDLWAARFGSSTDWAAAWLELRPERVYSFSRA